MDKQFSGHISPSASESFKFISSGQIEEVGPNETIRDVRPERYSQMIECHRGTKASNSARFEGDNLDDRMADCKCAHIEMELIGEAELCVSIVGSESSTPLMIDIASNPHLHVVGDDECRRELMTDGTRIERDSMAFSVVDNHRLDEGE